MNLRLLAGLAGVTTAACALATSASAQPGSDGSGNGPNSSNQGSYQYNWGGDGPRVRHGPLPASYVRKLTALSYKTLEIKREDGGKLTPEHLASLQHELDQLIHQYRLYPGFRINAA